MYWWKSKRSRSRIPFSRIPGGTWGWPTAPSRMASQPREPVDLGVGQDLAGPQDSARRPGRTARARSSRPSSRATDRQHLEALGHHLRADTVAGDDAELDQNTLRGNSFGSKSRCTADPIVTKSPDRS